MEVIGIGSQSSRSEFEAMLQRAHFVSLHCPLTPKTRGLLGRTEIALMRPGAMVINYARGEVIDKQVLSGQLISIPCMARGQNMTLQGDPSGMGPMLLDSETGLWSAQRVSMQD